ncbi:hypothetical protein OYT88_03955 [Sporolactobacillus sp. CQH2019]|uniref:hypothetical protein n=1 Tax=Sporolactobacillus sp. CQH2019 TaxID=3023512 RepID=UPI002368B31B|nr:hypothetical protein [Sporolactobacillus sp. CQH2019]MDD9147705.1 hypothetical protein [Sporolactobacillus sp. CQH2019]
MNDNLQILLSALQTNYRFRRLKLIKDRPLIVETERGPKKIRIWNDERLLRKHVGWRMKLISDRFFIDRMYVTQSGNPFIRIGRFAVTCHDAPPDRAALSGNEPIWAETVSALIAKSRDSIDGHGKPVRVRQRAETIFEQCRQSGLFSGSDGELASACYPSVRERAEQADLLRSHYSRRSRSVILPDTFSLGDSRSLLDTLFIELGQSVPGNGYRGLARFFLDGIREGGEESLRSLFLYLQEKGVPDQETADLIRAEWFDPSEWFQLVDSLPLVSESGQRDRDLKAFKSTWDYKTRLIGLFDSVFSRPV